MSSEEMRIQHVRNIDMPHVARISDVLCDCMSQGCDCYIILHSLLISQVVEGGLVVYRLWLNFLGNLGIIFNRNSFHVGRVTILLTVRAVDKHASMIQ